MRGLVWLLLLAGCYFHVKEETSTRIASSDVRRGPVPGFAPAAIQASSIDGTFRIFVSHQRSCALDFVDHLEITHSKHMSFAIADHLDGYGFVFAILLAPITIPVSAAIAGVEVSGAHD